MSALLTENGRPSKAEANIAVAIQQGRITAEEAESWRDRYLERGYEPTTLALLENKPTRQIAPPSLSEEWYQAYARATNVIKPSGYFRSVV